MFQFAAADPLSRLSFSSVIIIIIVYYAKTEASTHLHTITKIQKHTKLKNIQKLLKQYKTTFLNYKNRYEMRIEYKR